MILVADDQEASRAPLVKSLRQRGFGVYETDCGQKALAMLEQHRISIVISDISMPNGNGIELLTKAKKLKQKTHVFLMSDYPELYAENEGFNLADGVFKKPINPEEVVRAVEAACGRAIISSSLVA